VADYTLPDLPYDYSALAPAISPRIMELHHDKHHAAYVAGANLALEKLDEIRAAGNFATVNMLEKNLAFNLGGHVNHSIFWKNLSPDGGDKPDGELGAAIDDNFGSWDTFRAQFEAVALGIQGSGWAIVAWDGLSQKLVIVQLYDHQANIAPTLVPIAILDMWEHAFYLDYVNVKADYIKAWWTIVNWADAQERFAAATSGGQILF
jgi:Fe-Mn family superoxide dismutase